MDLASVKKEVLAEILLRLPAKSLIKFKSVCKKWLSLISSDDFCHQHTLCHPKLQQSLIIQMHSLQFFYFNQIIDGGKVMRPYSPSVPDHKIRQDCNGLLLLERKHSYYVYNTATKNLESNPKNSYYVYNPTTRQSRKITPTQSDEFPYVEDINLAFDPSKSPYYKLVCVRSTSYKSSDSYPCRIEVYDSESHTWKLGLEPFIHPRIYKRGVHWNNSIFWSIRSVDYNNYDYRICCFDIAKNEIKYLSFPRGYDGPEKTGDFGYLQESNGHLYCFQLLNDFYGVTVGVWELGGDDHSEWLSRHHGEIHPPFNQDVSPVRFVGGGAGDGATSSLLIHDPQPEGMMAYNFPDHSYNLLVPLKGLPIDLLGRVMKGFLFGEILALV